MRRKYEIKTVGLNPESYRKSRNPETFVNNVKRGICSHFGCGKSLSLTESLYGNRCIDHQHINIVTEILEEKQRY